MTYRDTIKIGWRLVWSLIALPFALVTVFCAFMAGGPKDARNWAKHLGICPLNLL